MSRSVQLVGLVTMLIGILMSAIGDALIQKDSLCNCPAFLSPRPYSIPIVPINDGILLYLGISFCLSGIAIFVISYFKQGRLVHN